MKPRIVDIQFFHILDVLKPVNCPEVALKKVQSFIKRSSHLNTSSKGSEDLMQRLNDWVSLRGSSLFVVQVGPRAEFKAKEFAAEVIDFLRTTEYTVLWNVSHLTTQLYPPSLADIIMSLVSQALNHNPAALCKDRNDVNIAKFKQLHTETEWRALFLKIFSQMAQCFLIIEAHDLFQAYREDSQWTTRFIQLFQDLINQAESSSRSLKVLLLNYNKEDSNSNAKNRVTSVIPVPIPIPPRLRRKLVRIRTRRKFRDLCPRF
jgi:hypothetical protein